MRGAVRGRPDVAGGMMQNVSGAVRWRVCNLASHCRQWGAARGGANDDDLRVDMLAMAGVNGD